MAIRLERLYHEENGRLPSQLQEQKQEAEAIVTEVCRPRLLQGVPPRTSGQLRSTSALLWLSILSGALIHPGSLQAASLELTAEQQRVLLDEGIELFELGTKNPDAIEAADQYRGAAEKFQLLVDTNVRNDRLYFNLAEAAHRSGEFGLAIANYQRALRLDPSSDLYHKRLVMAETSAGIGVSEREDLLSRARRMNDWLLQWISPTIMFAGFALAWLAFWIALAVSLLRWKTPWKPIAVTAFFIALLCGGSYLLRVTEFTRDDTAILVSSSVSLRQGDGESFSEVAKITQQAGRPVQVLGQRGEWLQVATESGQQGWIRRDQGMVI